jgi:hypothetical protein
MGAKKKAAATAGGAVGAAKAAKNSPYVQRLVQAAISRLSNGKSPAKQVFDDKKLQKEIREAAFAIRDASLALREAPKRSKPKRGGGGGFFRKVLLLAVAGGLALALSEGLRKKVLDALFGAEEEFEYTSTTTASTGGATGGATTTSTPASA